ncbi:MAG: hypothetical protein OEU32_16655, partial [Acidimicrobiia bacterium]|nr:hypothetical protein [Acidimicrobiia bacterium]
MTVTESSLSPDRAAALAGPDWLRNRRRAAAELLATAVWPTEAAEEWRYSPIDELDLHSFVPTAVAGSATPIRLATAAGTIDLANGVATSIDVAPEHAARGVRLARLADLDDGESFVGELPGADDPLGLMVAAFAPDPVVLQIPAGLTLADELVVSSSIEVGSSNDTPPSVLTQVIVDAGPDSEVTVVIVDASARADALHVPRVDVRIGPAARVRVAALQDLGSGVTSLGRMQVTIADQATFAGWTAGLGGGFARQRVD